MFARQLDTGFAGEVHGDRPSLGLEHELTAREIGSPGLVISAPFAGRLFGVLPRCGYTETAGSFSRPFQKTRLQFQSPVRQ